MTKIVSYKNPPLAEVVIGLQLSEEAISHQLIQDFYENYKGKFPNIQEHPPLQSIIEKKEGNSEIGLPSSYSSRKFFIETIGNKLVQIQRNKLLFNWRALENNAAYPHFDDVLNEFLGFVDYINKKTNGTLMNKINQLEFTYVDHISFTDLEEKKLSITDIVNFLSIKKDFKSLSCNFSVWDETVNGILNISLKTGRRNKDLAKIYILETTCRGYNDSSNELNIWFKDARKILLEYFESITTDKAKKLWEKETLTLQ